jgi:hypothetical protein
VRQSGCGILECHRPGETRDFIDRHVCRHTDTAYRRPTRDVINHDEGFKADPWLSEQQDF